MKCLRRTEREWVGAANPPVSCLRAFGLTTEHEEQQGENQHPNEAAVCNDAVSFGRAARDRLNETG